MDIAFHIGAHSTDEDLLVKSLRMNAGRLAQEGILVPAPDIYRPVLGDAFRRLQGQPADAEMESAILDAVLDGAEGRRIVFSSENFICVPQVVFDNHQFYAKMGFKAQWMRNTFPDRDVEFHIGLRNPATLVPAMFRRKKKDIDFDAFLATVNLDALSWLPVIMALRNAVPDCWITVWCNEDTPLIWPEIMQAVTDHAPETRLSNEDAVLKKILSEEGLMRLRSYLDANPPSSVDQRRRITMAFFDKYGLENRMEERIDFPAWTQDVMDQLTEDYDADVEAIADLDNVDVLFA